MRVCNSGSFTIHLVIVSAVDLAPVLSSGVYGRRELTILEKSMLSCNLPLMKRQQPQNVSYFISLLHLSYNYQTIIICLKKVTVIILVSFVYLLPPISSLFRMSQASTSTSNSQKLSLSMLDPRTQSLEQEKQIYCKKNCTFYGLKESAGTMQTFKFIKCFWLKYKILMSYS